MLQLLFHYSPFLYYYYSQYDLGNYSRTTGNNSCNSLESNAAFQALFPFRCNSRSYSATSNSSSTLNAIESANSLTHQQPSETMKNSITMKMKPESSTSHSECALQYSLVNSHLIVIIKELEEVGHYC